MSTERDGAHRPMLRRLTVGVGALGLLVVGVAPSGLSAAPEVFEGPVPRADCGPGSTPEADLQGRVPVEDRDSGRSQQGYACNLELLGQYQGQGTSWVSQMHGHCAYQPQAWPTSAASAAPGVHVVDVSDPADPVLSTRLTSPAFAGNTWESLKVNPERGLLAGVFVGSGLGAAFFDVYDISEDCANPKLLNSVPIAELSTPGNVLGHEGNWSPDGNTYWATSLAPGGVTAIDVSDPALPTVVYTGVPLETNHGLSVSNDGNRLYLASLIPAGLVIFDVSEVQQRRPGAQIHEVGSVFWEDGNIGQHAINVTWDGKPYIIFVDEGGLGAARIIDISDETAPRVVSKLKLEIHMPGYQAERDADLEGNGGFGYEGHYCDVDRLEDPTAIACGYFQSGVRVFDIRDPMAPREVAYLNPPGQVGRAAELPGSEHAQGAIGGGPTADGVNMTTDWCSSPPRFANGDQLWVHCQDNGFMALQFTNGAYPLEEE